MIDLHELREIARNASQCMNRHILGRRGSDVLALIEEVDAMRAALKIVHDWRGLCDANETETFERIAEQFRSETGMLRPGKDDRGGTYSQEQRRECWELWTAKKNAEVDAAILRAMIGGAP